MIVVADPSVLLNLCRIERAGLLASLFGEVLAPPEVLGEFAFEKRADALLIDERRGRHAALKVGIKTIGVLGIILQAKQAGLVLEIRPLIDKLMHEAQFWISPTVRQRVLSLAGE